MSDQKDNDFQDVDIFNGTEKSRIEKYQQKFDDLVERAFEDGAPKRFSEMRAAKEILEAASANIIKIAEIKNKAKKDKADTNIKTRMIETVKQAAIRRQQQLREARNSIGEVPLELDESFIPNDIVEGELEINPAPLNVKEFLKGDDDDN